jgi:hypothetical protein
MCWCGHREKLVEHSQTNSSLCLNRKDRPYGSKLNLSYCFCTCHIIQNAIDILWIFLQVKQADEQRLRDATCTWWVHFYFPQEGRISVWSYTNNYSNQTGNVRNYMVHSIGMVNNNAILKTYNGMCHVRVTGQSVNTMFKRDPTVEGCSVYAN